MSVMHFDVWNTFRTKLREFAHDDGAVTVEFVMWVPVFILMLGLMVDVSVMFLRQATMWQAARETARYVSVRQITTVAEAEAYAEERATFAGDVPDASVQITGTHTRVEISVPFSEVGVFGYLNIGGSNDLVTAVVYALEPT